MSTKFIELHEASDQPIRVNTQFIVDYKPIGWSDFASWKCELASGTIVTIDKRTNRSRKQVEVHVVETYDQITAMIDGQTKVEEAQAT